MICGSDYNNAFAVWKMLFYKLGCVLQIFHGIKRMCFHSYGGGRYAAFFGGDEHGFIFCHVTKGSLLHLSSAKYEMRGLSLVKEYFAARKDQLCETCRDRLDKNPMRILDCKIKHCQELGKDAPVILDYLCDDCKEHFEKLQEYLSVMGIDFDINPKIVRGLDYYTRTVFEFITDEIGAQGTVCGGGRYDGLIEQLGGKPTPALGFGLGLERLLMVMDAQGCDYMEPKTCDLYIVPMGEDALKKAMGIASELREEGCFVEYDLIGKGLNAQMKYANKIGAKFVMVLGDNEIESGVAKLKNMATGEQTDIRLDNTIAENFSNALMADMFKDIDADIEKFIGKEN